MTKNNEQIIENLGSEKCIHRAHLGYKGAPYFKKCYSCRLQNHQLEALQANNTTEYWYKCNTENCLFKKLKAKEQECEELKEEVALLKESNSKLQLIEDASSIEKCYLQQLDQLKKENYELKQMLAEIKEIAYDSYSNGQTSYATFQCEKIINKINEAEDVNN